jgi:phage FluMu protein Com
MANELRGESDLSRGENLQPTEQREECSQCDKLLAISTEETVEIKCRRCKRIHVIPIQRKKRGQQKQQPETIKERCECGNVLAMISEETVEIKCRGCKNILVIPVKVQADYWQKKNLDQD